MPMSCKKSEFENVDFEDRIQATNAADAMITAIRAYAGEPIELRWA